MNHLSKLQSEAVKELDNKIKNIIDSGWMCCDKEGDGCNCYKRALLTKVKAIKDIIADQIQKAVEETRKETIEIIENLKVKHSINPNSPSRERKIIYNEAIKDVINLCKNK